MKTQRDLVLTALAIGAATTATGVVLTPFVAPVMLGVVGFGVAGPVAGSIAAGVQAGIGANVAAGSLFAVAQSIAMGGGVPAVISAVGGLGAGAAGAAVAAVAI